MKSNCNFYLLVLCLLMMHNISFGQLFHPDPYKVDFSYLNIECTKKEVVKNKIKRITSKEYAIKNGTKTEVPKTSYYFVEFNEAGNPVHYRYKYFMQTYNPKDEVSETTDYYFMYDSLYNLIHVQEYEIHSLSPKTYYVNDVYYIYNKNKLISETYSDKTIYAPGFTYNGTTYDNDTSITTYFINYNSLNNQILVFSQNYQTYNHTLLSDTIKYNCPFDSIFIDKEIPKGMKKDSFGRVIQNTRYTTFYTTSNGCFSPDSPSDIITDFFYDNNGKLIRSESHLRKETAISKRIWSYNENGLLQFIQNENSSEITMYEYEYY